MLNDRSTAPGWTLDLGELSCGDCTKYHRTCCPDGVWSPSCCGGGGYAHTAGSVSEMPKAKDAMEDEDRLAAPSTAERLRQLAQRLHYERELGELAEEGDEKEKGDEPVRNVCPIRKPSVLVMMPMPEGQFTPLSVRQFGEAMEAVNRLEVECIGNRCACWGWMEQKCGLKSAR